MIENLWATPVAVYDTQDAWGNFEEANSKIIGSFPKRSKEENHFFFKDLPVMNEFTEVLRKYADRYSIESGLEEELLAYGGFFNIYQPGDSNTPHGHPRCNVVAVYVAQSDPSHGNLLLQDPRGAVNWKNEKDEDSRGTNYWRTFRRYNLKPGELIFFPGFVVHSVETNQSYEAPDRLSIGINLYSREFLRHFNV